jgi:hypothetical protein
MLTKLLKVWSSSGPPELLTSAAATAPVTYRSSLFLLSAYIAGPGGGFETRLGSPG